MSSRLDSESFDRIWRTLEPRKFNEVPGRSAVLQALKNRVRHQSNATPMILYGPSGVGKSMLAKLYAKAILCDRLDPDGSSCNRCDQCKNFDIGQYGFGYIEVKTFPIKRVTEDTGQYHDRLERRTDRLQSILTGQSWADRRVVVLGQVDRYPVKAFDVLLKAIEDSVEKTNGMFIKQTSTTLVLMAQDLNRVRRAGRSRCLDYRVRQLTDAESGKLIVSLVDLLNLPVDERAVSLLVQAANGLPSLIKYHLYQVAQTGEITIDSVREVLKLDWVDATAKYWSALLADEVVPAAVLRPRGDIPLSEQVRRVKLMLYELKPNLSGSPSETMAHSDPALMFKSGDLSITISDRFIDCAKLVRKNPIDLWGELVQVWISSDITDELSFIEAGRLTNALVRHWE